MFNNNNNLQIQDQKTVPGYTLSVIYDRYMAEFRGRPDTKILQIDFDMLGCLNRNINRLGLESAKRMIDAKEGTRDSRLLTWKDFK